MAYSPNNIWIIKLINLIAEYIFMVSEFVNHYGTSKIMMKVFSLLALQSLVWKYKRYGKFLNPVNEEMALFPL